MYDELVKRLHRYTENCVAYKLDADFASAVQEAADAIEEFIAKLNHADDQIERLVEAAEERRWIPVTERLPEEHVFVLIRQDDDRMMVAVRVDGDWWYRYFAYDVDRWDENEQGTITHWMPLPEPLEEE